MYSTCPECGTVFRVSAADLRVAEGHVRCGHCSAVFNALLTLAEEPPAAPGIPAASPSPAGEELPPWESDGESAGDFGWEADAPPVAESEPGPEPEPATHHAAAGPEESTPDLGEDEETGEFPPLVLAGTEEADGEAAPQAEDPGDWSRLFDEEDLREVTARLQVDVLAAASGAPDRARDDEPDEDGPGEDAEMAPVYVIGDEGSAHGTVHSPVEAAPGAEPPTASVTGAEAGGSGGEPFGPWAWEVPAAATARAAGAAEEAPRVRRLPDRPVEDLWAEEFGDTVIPEPRDATTRQDPTLESLESLESPDDFPGPVPRPESAPPADPGDPGPLPPLWTQRPGGWDYPAAAEAPPERRWTWALGSVLLALALGAQWIHTQRDTLAAQAGLGTVLRQAYATAGLELYPAWDLGAYEIRGTEAVAGRSRPGALDVLARINVVGTTPVGLPLVRVTLRDRFGKVLGARALEPGEYLEPGSTLRDPVAPGTVIPVRVSLADPGNDAYGYEVDVCLRDRRTGLSCQSERAPFRG